MTCRLPGFESAKKEQQKQELIRHFRVVFSGESGRIVLNALLKDLHFFDEANGSAESALSDYAKFFIRERLGILNSLVISDALEKTISDRKD